MAKMIQLRNVPDDVHRIFKVRAAQAGMSLSDYIKRDLEASATLPTLEEIDARVRSRSPSKLATAAVLSTLRDLREG